jgi:hypothetical protein
LLNNIYNKDMSVFSNTIRANPSLWKKGLIAKVFGISKKGMAMPQKVPAVNNSLKYFGGSAHKKEGLKFLDCKVEELRDVLNYMTPQINPMKLASVTGKITNIVVESFYLHRKVFWARILEDVMANHIKLL